MSNLLALPGKIVALLSGKKMYLTGLAMCLAALSGELNALAGVKGILDLVNLLKVGAGDPNIVLFLQGVAVLTGRAAISKLE